MSIQIHNAHDAIFKTFFTDIDVATNFITIYLPKHMKQACDFSTLKIEPGSFVDADLKQHHSDILYSLKVNGIKGETANVNQVIEKLKTIEEYEEDIMNAAQQLKQQGRQEGLQKGLQEGRHLNAITIAKKLITQGRSIQYIQDLTDLSETEVMDLVDKH